MVQVMEKIKLSKQTLDYIGSFANINPSMLFKTGNVLYTISEIGDVMAAAEIEEEIPCEFGVHDLSKFLSILSTFNNPELNFANDYIVIKQENSSRKYKYRYCAPNMIKFPTKTHYNIENPIASFNIQEKTLKDLVKTVSISGHPEIAFVGYNNVLTVQAYDDKNANPDSYKEVLSTDIKNEFKVRLKLSKINVLFNKLDYSVTLSENICNFKGAGITYYIAPEGD